MGEPKVPDPEFTRKVIEGGGETVNLCYQCGTCTGSCPSGRQTAYRVRKVIRQAQLGLKDDILPHDELWMCTTCYTCYERCPRGVAIVDIIMALRNVAVREGYMAEAHRKTAMNLASTGHMVPIDDKRKALRKKLGLDEEPNTVAIDEKALDDFKRIIKATGFDKLCEGGECK